LKYGLKLVLETLAINLIAHSYHWKIFVRFLDFPQNKMPYFKDECKYAKYMVFTVFLFKNESDCFDCKTEFA
jgi:hypothetical protein